MTKRQAMRQAKLHAAWAIQFMIDEGRVPTYDNKEDEDRVMAAMGIIVDRLWSAGTSAAGAVPAIKDH